MSFSENNIDIPFPQRTLWLNQVTPQRMAKILIIEDEEPIRRVLKRILEDENKTFIIDEAEDGKAGIDALLANDYDLVYAILKCQRKMVWRCFKK